MRRIAMAPIGTSLAEQRRGKHGPNTVRQLRRLRCREFISGSAAMSWNVNGLPVDDRSRQLITSGSIGLLITTC